MLYFDVSGTNAIIGESIGEQFKQRINNYVDYRFQQMSDEFSKLCVNFDRSEYYCISDQLIQYTQQHAIQELQELQGVSRATNIPLEDILFAVGYTDIFDIILSQKGKLSTALYEANSECTTFIFNKLGLLLCGQNWDMDEGSSNNCCYFRKQYSNGDFVQGLSSVIGLLHIGINANGMFVGTANLSSLKNTPRGLVFPITIQHLLRSGINDRSKKWLKTTSKAGGHYFYIVNKCIPAITVECDGTKSIIRQIFGNYAHTNHYREAFFKENGILYSSDSIVRCQYIENALDNQVVNIDSIKQVLSNHENNICRHSETQGYSQTCAAIILDVYNQQIHLCESSPCKGIWNIKSIDTKLKENSYEV